MLSVTILLACLPQQQPKRAQNRELTLPWAALLSMFLFLSRMWPCMFFFFFFQKNRRVCRSPACLPCTDRLLEASSWLNEGTAKIHLPASLLREWGNVPEKWAHSGWIRRATASRVPVKQQSCACLLLAVNPPASSNKATPPHPVCLNVSPGASYQGILCWKKSW